MKDELERLQQSFQDAGHLLDDALDILTRRDEKYFSQDDMHTAMNKLFKLRDKYFLGFTNWNHHIRRTAENNVFPRRIRGTFLQRERMGL